MCNLGSIGENNKVQYSNFEEKGYRITIGVDNFKHFFGGESWIIPFCPQCNEKMHQIITFDLLDNRIKILKHSQMDALPLISCLNCSLVWSKQLFKLNFEDKTIEIIEQNNNFEWKCEKEDALPIPLPKFGIRLDEMKKEDNPTSEEEYEVAIDLLGREYFCRLLGKPLILDDTLDLICPCCKKEMTYIASLSGEDYDNEPQLVPTIHFNFGELYIHFSFCTECLILKTESQVL